MTLFQIFLPIACCLFILYFQHLADYFSSLARPTPVELNLIPLSKCEWTDCTTIGYGIVGDSKSADSDEYAWIAHTMKHVAQEADLDFGTDVKLVSMGTPTDFKNYLDQNKNQTQYGVIFCTTEWLDDVTTNITIPCVPDSINKAPSRISTYFYTLVYNISTAPNSFG